MTAPFNLPSSAFLDSLKALFPASSPITRKSIVLDNPWYIVAAVAYCASNRPEAVPVVWEYAINDVRSAPLDENLSGDGKDDSELLLARRFREALFKCGLVCGYPRSINALRALHAVMPPELQDKTILRDTTQTLNQLEDKDVALFSTMHGDNAEHVQSILDAIHPDLGYLSKAMGYGLIYQNPLSPSTLDSAYTIVAALIAIDAPQQIIWHLAGARRQASLEEVRAVRRVAVEVAREAGVRWLNEVPEVV
ncbi:hypothetical protein CVT24_009140 [Panaeolus cyanescens]|uniref:Carboxymuconolactone decarboxylase-like domain-containing protein n=1 Tax=Panaeolus cyanescens TaxID=181874 RepID=A0A409WCQ4_9AGAR|nr:hypothetical protein CVT24_009140 [Panaeolus cyanescens]